MIDRPLRLACFWIAAFAAVLALVGILFPLARVVLPPLAVFVGCTAVLLFVRILFTRAYRRGVDAANLEIGAGEPQRKGSWRLFDPDWGLFGRRTGSPALIGMRTVLVFGITPMNYWQDELGAEVRWRWFAAAFVAMELTLMHAALLILLKTGAWSRVNDVDLG